MGLEQAKATALARSTAEGAALLRAAGHLMDHEHGNPDHLAASFIAPGLSATALVRLPGARHVMPRAIDRILPGGLWFEVVRTRGMDELLLREVDAGCTQVVLLGAGLDSRAYRLRDRLTTTTFFEVDHPTTSAHKRRRVKAVIAEEPANVRYVVLDFDTDSLAERLAAQGFQAAAPAVLLWSGVVPYLRPAAVDRTLAWVATLAPGTTIAFDYLWQEYLDGACRDMLGARALRRHVESLAEPFASGIPRGGARAFVEARGLELVEDLDAAEGVRRYLTRPDGTTLGELWAFGGVVVARVPAVLP